MSDPFPAPDAAQAEPTPPAQPTADPPTPLARLSDPSLPAAPGERQAPRGGSIEWVRPAELQRRAATKVASAGLNLGRRGAALRSRAFQAGKDSAKRAHTNRAAKLSGTEAGHRTPAPEAPSREGPTL